MSRPNESQSRGDHGEAKGGATKGDAGRSHGDGRPSKIDSGSPAESVPSGAEAAHQKKFPSAQATTVHDASGREQPHRATFSLATMGNPFGSPYRSVVDSTIYNQAGQRAASRSARIKRPKPRR